MNFEAQLDASKEVGLEVNAEKTKYIFMSRHQTAGQNCYIKLANKSLPVTVAERSEAWVLAGWLLGSWVRILLKAWMFVCVFLWCVVLCR
jgi:hypothetical protein